MWTMLTMGRCWWKALFLLASFQLVQGVDIYAEAGLLTKMNKVPFDVSCKTTDLVSSVSFKKQSTDGSWTNLTTFTPKGGGQTFTYKVENPEFDSAGVYRCCITGQGSCADTKVTIAGTPDVNKHGKLLFWAERTSPISCTFRYQTSKDEKRNWTMSLRIEGRNDVKVQHDKEVSYESLNLRRWPPIYMKKKTMTVAVVLDVDDSGEQVICDVRSKEDHTFSVNGTGMIHVIPKITFIIIMCSAVAIITLLVSSIIVILCLKGITWCGRKISGHLIFKSIENNRTRLTRALDFTPMFEAYMVEADVVGPLFIKALEGKNKCEKAKKLLNIISKGTVKQYEGFRYALKETNQEFEFLPSIAVVTRDKCCPCETLGINHDYERIEDC